MDSESQQLPYLETFAKAAESSSFTRAAKAMRLTQAAVSQRIAALEQTLGKPLFHRQGGRVALSEAGKQLYEYTQRILELHAEARRQIAGHHESISGTLALAASSIPGDHLLPDLLARFHAEQPQIQIRASVSDSMRVMEQVEQGEVSIGLVGRKADHPHLEFRPFAHDRMLLVVPRGHPLARRKKAAWHQLAEFPLLLRETGSGSRHALEKAVEKAGRALRDFRLGPELGSNEAIKEAIHKGMGVAVLSEFAVRRELESGTLIGVEIDMLSAERELYIVFDRRRVLPPPVRLFVNFLEREGMGRGAKA